MVDPEILFDGDESCSCHISPPCERCTSGGYCETCDETQYPINRLDDGRVLCGDCYEKELAEEADRG